MSRGSRVALVALAVALMVAPAAAVHPVVAHLYAAGLSSLSFEVTHLALLGLVAIALVSVVPAAGFTVAIMRAVRAVEHLRALTHNSQPAGLEGLPYRLLPSDAVFVFTAGVIRPVTFVSAGAERDLGQARLRAALLHEQAHQRSQDVMWRLLLRAVGRGFAFIPWVSHVVESETLRTECLADDYAIRGGVRRIDLFEAIVAASAASASPLTAGLTDAHAAFRLQRLVDPQIPLPGPSTRSVAALAAAMALPAGVSHVLAFGAALGASHLM